MAEYLRTAGSEGDEMIKTSRVPVYDPENKTYILTLSDGCQAIVDEDDLGVIEGFNWQCIRGYATRKAYEKGKITNILLHRTLVNCPKDKVVDHINGNKLDNRKSNLRICTQSENTKNTSGHSNKKHTFYKGIYKRKSGNWSVVIVTNGVSTQLGTFKDEKEAAYAYDKAAIKLHGEFAKLNNPYEELFNSLLRLQDDLETKKKQAASQSMESDFPSYYLGLEKGFRYAMRELKKIIDDHPNPKSKRTAADT